MKLDQPCIHEHICSSQVCILGGDFCENYEPDKTFKLSNRAIAAIHLCVPDSGDEQLDAIIRRAQRERLAGQSVNGLISSPCLNPHFVKGLSADEQINHFSKEAYKLADALMAAGEVGK
jgi:hypothetical protein